MVILSLLIGMIKHSQITQKNKFAISRKKVMYGVPFSHAVFDKSNQTCSEYPK